MRPPCYGEPNAAQPLFMPTANMAYRSRSPRDTGVGPERFSGARIELDCHYGAASKDERSK